MPLPPRLDAEHLKSLFVAGKRPEDVVMPCQACGAMPAIKVNLVGVEKRLCSPCHSNECSDNWEIWNS